MKMMKKIRAHAALLALGLCAVVPMTQAGVAERVQRAKVGPVDVVVYPMDVKDVVTVSGVMPLGDAAVATRSINPAVATLTGLMVQQGTTKQDKFTIDDTLSAIGAQAQISPDDTMLNLYGKSLKKDMPTVVGLLVEQLRMPAFAAEELVKTKMQMGAMVQMGADDPDSRAYEALAQAMFAKDSPLAPVGREALLKAIEAATLDQVKAFHARYYGPAHMTLVFTGDVDLAAAKATVANAIAGWSGGMDFARTAAPAPAAKAQVIDVAMQDKASISVMWGQATGLHYVDADYLPLQVGVNILGSGFTGRLMANVRDKEGLTYGIGAELFASEVVEGGFMVSSSFAPELLDKGVASARRQLDLWWQKGVTADELDARKQALVGRYQLQLGTTDGMARSLLMTQVRGQELSWLDAYPQKIAALTQDQINTAIRAHLDPAKMVLVKAGTFAKP